MVKKIRKVGFLGGTFDPIHLGHIHLALQMLEMHGLEQVLFCPTSQSPHKEEKPPVASREDRKAMVARSLAPVPAFTLIDLEIQKSGPTYTIDTIRKLMEMDGATGGDAKQYFLILGDDTIERLQEWKECEELALLAPPLVGTRGDKPVDLKHLPKPVAAAVKKGMTEIPIIEISSTAIRERMEKGLYCGHLVSTPVWELIQEKKIYQPS
jgi:nicotinate-nucleotide adenylyltransferase